LEFEVTIPGIQTDTLIPMSFPEVSRTISSFVGLETIASVPDEKGIYFQSIKS
jgi:hypothetical protein